MFRIKYLVTPQEEVYKDVFTLRKMSNTLSHYNTTPLIFLDDCKSFNCELL